MGFNTLGQNARAVFHDIFRDPDLVGFWPLNEGSSTIYDRQLTKRANGVMASSPTYGASAAPGFPGITMAAANGHYASMGNQTHLDFASNATFSALAVYTINSTAVMTIAGKYNSANVQGWAWALNVSGQQQVIFGAGGSSYIHRVSCATNATGVPIMGGFSFSPANGGTGSVAEPEDFIFYTNGVGSTLGTNGASFALGSPTSTNDFRIGGTANGALFFNGTIAFVAVFNGLKTPIDFKRWARLGGFV